MILIDIGASHNFINAEFTKKKNLNTKGFEGFRVFNANGKLTLVDHIFERFGVILLIFTMREDLYIYSLKGNHHITFGVQWLFDLGDIHTNYQKLTMSVDIDGKTYTLQGIRDDFPQVENKLLEVIEWC